MIKPKTIADVYLADYMEIQGSKEIVKGHFTDIKKKFKLDDKRLHESLLYYFEHENIQIQFKVDKKY